MKSRHIILILAIAISIVCFLRSDTEANPTCFGGTCAVQTVKRVVQPQVVVPQYPNYYYQVGSQLQQQAVSEHSFRHSEEYQEYLQLKSWRAGFEAYREMSGGVGQVEPAGSAPESSTPSPPSTPVATPLEQHCGKCHSGDNPKGDFWVTGVDLLSPDAAVKRDKIVGMVYRGEMPPNKPLEDSQFAAILQQLYGEQNEGE